MIKPHTRSVQIQSWCVTLWHLIKNANQRNERLARTTIDQIKHIEKLKCRTEEEEEEEKHTEKRNK